MIQDFKIAFEKANLINCVLSKKKDFKDDSFVKLESILDAVKAESGYSEISLTSVPFSKILKKEGNNEEYNRDISNTKCGAMLSTMTDVDDTKNQERKNASILVNSDLSTEMQRFSIVHELGHLITEVPNFTYETPNDGCYTLSAHIDPDITYISDEKCEGNKYLIAEQIANIFALLVLIPEDIKIRDLVDSDIKSLMKKYGVTQDALYSRMLLSNVKVE